MKRLGGHSFGLAVAVGSIVALGGCAAAGAGGVGIGALGMGLSLLLTLAGAACTSSHTTSRDNDGDGHAQDVDCNDEDATIHPGADEMCRFDCDGGGDAKDNDCDGTVDEDCGIVTNCFPYEDADADGYPIPGDCNDMDPSIHPGAFDDCCDMIDQDCDGLTSPADVACNCFYDADGDGYGEGFGPGPDCNDMDPTIHPDAIETACDGVDQDCDGRDNPLDDPGCAMTDADGDGWIAGPDCDDGNAGVYPGAPEYCDGVDNDCDGLVDDADPDGCIILNGMLDIDLDDERPA
jgi:hypothetical protein